MFQALFEPGAIGMMILKNRLIMAPVSGNLAAEDGAVSEERDEEERILLLRRTDRDNPWGLPDGANELGERADCADAHEPYGKIGLKVGRGLTLIVVYSALSTSLSIQTATRCS